MKKAIVATICLMLLAATVVSASGAYFIQHNAAKKVVYLQVDQAGCVDHVLSHGDAVWAPGYVDGYGNWIPPGWATGDQALAACYVTSE